MLCAGRRVLVTGAGAGLGRAFALALAAAGADVVCAVRRPETGSAVVAEIERASGRACWVECDVRDAGHIRGAVTAACSRGSLDVVVHNATSPLSSQQRVLEDVDDEFWEEVVSTNLRAACRLARESYEALRASRGTLILLASAAGIEGVPQIAGYAAAKAAVRSLAKSLAQEWGPEGITVNCLAPAAMTDAYRRVLEQREGFSERLRATLPLGRIGDPLADIAPALVFLASPAARYMTGQTVVATGGRMLLL
jgi:NAD(P)-dependent dehydrogenase (short-subunit alcohol dehydrogenase family)